MESIKGLTYPPSIGTLYSFIGPWCDFIFLFFLFVFCFVLCTCFFRMCCVHGRLLLLWCGFIWTIFVCLCISVTLMNLGMYLPASGPWHILSNNHLQMERRGCSVGWQPCMSPINPWVCHSSHFVGSLSSNVGFVFPRVWALLGPSPLG